MKLHKVELTDFMFPCVTYVKARLNITQNTFEFIKGIGWEYKNFNQDVVKKKVIYVCG